MITNFIIISCIVIFLLIKHESGDSGVAAIKYGAMYPPRVEIKKEYWRFVSANFVHTEIVHIFMNMYCIFYTGRIFEQILNPLAYVFLIMISGLSTTIVTYVVALKKPNLKNTISLGASGIFYGYLGAMIALGIILQGMYMNWLMDNMFIIAINIFFTFANKQVSKTGHFGGLIGGFVAMALLIGAGVCGY